MGIRAAAAVALGRAARWGGETFMHRSAGNIPGAMALKVDPMVLVDLAKKVNPVAVISGTNGKTTTTNLVADCLQTAGVPLYCNREGNNLQSGIVTSLMLAPDTSKVVDAASAAQAPVGCFECDEMYTKYVLPRLRPHYFMLLNLFRDQLDRFGEIDRIQATIAEALAKTPETTFVFNGDDPLCAAIADRIPNKSLAFGIASDMGLSADRISDSRFCQKCGGALEYDYVHYGQLGAYRCPDCGWARPELAFAATNVRLEEDGFVFDIDGRSVHTGHTGAYMVYNVLAAYVISKLAKNPTGFNQNIRIVLNERGRVLALFVNDNDADGHDVSWFWDIDFERWSQIEGLRAFVGGTRANDMQVRLKYAGIQAEIVENYTALPAVRRELEGLEAAAKGEE